MMPREAYQKWVRVGRQQSVTSKKLRNRKPAAAVGVGLVP